MRYAKGFLIYFYTTLFMKQKKEGRTIFSADADKLAQIIEKDENFNATIDGLTKMDSYLN